MSLPYMVDISISGGWAEAPSLHIVYNLTYGSLALSCLHIHLVSQEHEKPWEPKQLQEFHNYKRERCELLDMA